MPIIFHEVTLDGYVWTIVCFTGYNIQRWFINKKIKNQQNTLGGNKCYHRWSLQRPWLLANTSQTSWGIANIQRLPKKGPDNQTRMTKWRKTDRVLVNTQWQCLPISKTQKKKLLSLSRFQSSREDKVHQINGQRTETCCEMKANFCRKCIKKGEVYFRCFLVPQPTWLENELGAHLPSYVLLKFVNPQRS